MEAHIGLFVDRVGIEAEVLHLQFIQSADRNADQLEPEITGRITGHLGGHP